MRRTLSLLLFLLLSMAVSVAAESQKLAPKSTEGTEPVSLAVPVKVVNFPAVQGIAGTVNVANLPTDNGGNLRVALQNPSPSSVISELLSAPVEVPLGEMFYTDPFDASGAELITVAIDGVPCVPSNGTTILAGWLEFRLAPDLQFAACSDARPAHATSAQVTRAGTYFNHIIATWPNCGGTEARVVVAGQGSSCAQGESPVISSARVLLRP